jgi:hypothetical protein
MPLFACSLAFAPAWTSYSTINAKVDVAPLVEIPAGKRPVQDDGGDAPACPDLPGKIPDLLDHPKSACLAALQIESAYSMHSPASSLS